MTLIDIIIGIPMAWFTYKGIKKGLISELFSFVGLVVGIFAAIHFAEYVASMLNFDGEYSVLIAFFITFVGVVFLSFFLGKCVEGFVKMMKMGILNKIFGGLLGFLKSVCIISVILYYISILDYKEMILTKSVKEKSVFYSPVEKTGNLLIGKMKDYVEEAKKQNWKNSESESADNQEQKTEC